MEMWLRFARALEEDGPLLVRWLEWLLGTRAEVQRLELLQPFYHHEGQLQGKAHTTT